MSDDEEPIIDLPAKQQELENAIRKDPDEAWEMLQSDASFVLAITGVKRNLEGSKENNVVAFFKEYDKHVSLIFQKEHPIESYGIALATEFLTDYWRRRVSSTKISSINQAISEKMEILKVATDQLPDGLEKTVTSKIVNFSSQRVTDYVQYNKDKAKDHAIQISNLLNELVSNAIDPQNVEPLLSLAYFASTSAESLEVLRNHLARKLLRQLKPQFDLFEEEDKYRLAPYLSVFDKILRDSDAES